MSSLFWIAAMLTTPQSPHPIFLQTTPVPGGVEVQVVGRSAEAFSARYRLEVSSGSSGNRSSQGGQVRLQAGETHVMVTLRMSSGPAAEWAVRLLVEPDNQSSYEETAQSAASAN